MRKKEVDILDLLLVISKHKKFIIITTLIVSVIAIIYSLSATKYWASKATILPAKNQTSSTLTSFLGAGSSLFQGGLQPASTELIMIMKSRSFSEKIIKKFNLIEYLEIKDSDSLVRNEKATAYLNKKIRSISLDEETGLISIRIETKDKYFSADIANYYWKLLDEFNLKNRKTKGKQTREFIEKRINEIKKNIDSLSTALNKFQKENKTIDIPAQTSSLIELYSNLISQKINNAIDLSVSEKFLSPNSPKIEKLKFEQEVINRKVNELEFVEKEDAYYILNLNDMPDISLEYSRLLMNIEISKKVYEYLYPEYESAKIQEYKNLPTLEVIDRSVPAGKRSKPQRAKLCISAFFLAITLSIIYSVLIEYVRKYLFFPDDAHRWDKVKQGFRKSKCSQKE
ncbi:MAG: Wzz/FepE/Etk N-terminal domain-containing protein [Candidatus Cloacimonadota bacterium]|nr:Wzz/FepE/Etk N-terminal domain-containing protein [Candidatus Cloacimonadota bacterium]